MDKHRITKYTYLATQLFGLAILGITLNMVLNSTSRKSGIFELTVRFFCKSGGVANPV